MKKLYIILISLIVLSGCGVNNTKDTEYSLSELYVFEETTLKEFKDILRNFIYKLYSPSSQEDIEEALNIIKPYMTEEVFTDFKEECSSYKEDMPRNVISDLIILYGNKYNQSDSMERYYLSFNVAAEGLSSNKIRIEFKINPDGKIYLYNIWVE